MNYIVKLFVYITIITGYNAMAGYFDDIKEATKGVGTFYVTIHNPTQTTHEVVVNAQVAGLGESFNMNQISGSASNHATIEANSTVKVLMLKPLMTRYPHYKQQTNVTPPKLGTAFVRITVDFGRQKRPLIEHFDAKYIDETYYLDVPDVVTFTIE